MLKVVLCGDLDGRFDCRDESLPDLFFQVVADERAFGEAAEKLGEEAGEGIPASVGLDEEAAVLEVDDAGVWRDAAPGGAFDEQRALLLIEPVQPHREVIAEAAEDGVVGCNLAKEVAALAGGAFRVPAAKDFVAEPLQEEGEPADHVI